MDDLTEVTLEKIKVGMIQRFSKRFLDSSVRVDVVKLVLDEFEICLAGFLLGENVGSYRAIKYPCDWFQAIKERWFPLWLLKRWPVIYTVCDITAKVLYPEFRLAVPEKMNFMMMQVTKNDLKMVDGKKVVL